MKTGPVKTALITGGGSGMGRAAALALAEMGARVFVADLSLDAARETAEMAGGQGVALEVDIASPESVVQLFGSLSGQVESLDMLVHTAAVMGETASLEEIADDTWERMIAVNLNGVFYCAKGAVRLMKESGGGRIVLFSSVASLTPTPGAIAYSAAKGGVNMLARSLAVEAAKHNIRVNVIAPGYIKTPMLESLPEGFESYIIKKTPLKRLGQTDEIAGLVSFLASEEADFFTGQVLSPNGGLVI